MRKRFLVAGLAAVPLLLSGVYDASAQSLNTRQDASPGMKAKIGRTLTETRVHQAEEGGVKFNSNSIHDDCGPVNLGTTDTDGRKRISPRREEVVVITGDVTNVCR
jgi:hypothetical protein